MSARRRSAGLFAMATVIAACAVPPAVTTPDIGLEIPDAWIAGEAVAGEVGGPWWRAFDAPALDGLVAEALRNNRDLRIAAARVDAAIAGATIVGAERVPHVSAGLDGSRQRQNFVGFPIPGGGDEPLSTTYNSFGLGLGVSWEVDLWGRLRASHAAALADVEASEADLAAACLSLSARAVRGYFALTAARHQVDLAERAVESYERAAKEVGDRVVAGLSPALDDRLARTDLARGKAALAEREATYARERRLLEVLLGRYPAGTIDPSTDLPGTGAPVPAGLPAEMIARRPDVAAAERRVAAADSRVVAARRALYPRLSLTASGGTSSDSFSDLLDGDFRVWSIAGNLLQPIFEGGRLRARIDLESATAKEALESYANTVLTALREVETALAIESVLAAQEKELAESVVRANEARDLAADRYRLGVDGLLVVLEAQRRAIDNESRLIAVRRLRLDNRISLHLALGGGFDVERIRNEHAAPSGEESER